MDEASLGGNPGGNKQTCKGKRTRHRTNEGKRNRRWTRQRAARKGGQVWMGGSGETRKKKENTQRWRESKRKKEKKRSPGVGARGVKVMPGYKRNQKDRPGKREKLLSKMGK